MAETQEIELFIDENGELKVHIKGIKGKKCLTVLEGLEHAMGEGKSRELTSEYYEQPKSTDSTRIKGA